MKAGGRIWGCSFDGLKDHMVADRSVIPCWRERGFRPADVVLPAQAQAELKAGLAAKRSRVASGLGWPPEAIVNIQAGSRRVPVPLAWRVLIDARDRTAYWSLANGLSFSLPTVLASHIRDILISSGVNQQNDKIVIAIPNDLDETGQEGLIREISRFGFSSLELLWRPVAAALAWLDVTQTQIPSDLTDDDALIVVHIGPDAVECVSFRLRERGTEDGRRFILPVRDVPQRPISVCGSDWAFGLSELATGSDDFGAVWQVFSIFPEVWQTLAQRDIDSDLCPRVWHRGDSWSLWAPDLESIRESMWETAISRPKPLMQWLMNGCKIRPTPSVVSQSWESFLRYEVQKVLGEVRGRVFGLILSGPLVSRNPLRWIEPLGRLFQEKSLHIRVVSEPTIATIWAPLENRDIIAEGAFIYGCRRENYDPTYLDTLPPLDLLVGLRGNYEWRSLVDEKECEGGKPYSKRLDSEFNLRRYSRRVVIYLRKNEKDDFRKATIRFHDAPEQDVPLNTFVRMTPASGRAEVEFRPASNDFRGGRPVFLDYSQMEEVTELELPSSQRGWPPTAKINIDQEGTWLISAYLWGFPSFLKLDIKSPNYCTFLDNFKRDVKKRSKVMRNEQFLYLNIVDHDGRAGTPDAQALIDQTTTKLGNDLREILSYKGYLPYDRSDAVKHIRQAATWLYAAASHEVIEHLTNELRRRLVTANDVFEAAGRAFTTKEEMSLLYSAIERRLNTNATIAPFPINVQRAITNLLTYREFAPDALTPFQARQFTERALDIMQMYRGNNNFARGFFQAVHLFISLLRYRVVDHDFLNPENLKDEKLFEDIIACLKAAQRTLPFITAKLIKEVELYMFFKGSDAGIIEAISKQT